MEVWVVEALPPDSVLFRSVLTSEDIDHETKVLEEGSQQACRVVLQKYVNYRRLQELRCEKGAALTFDEVVILNTLYVIRPKREVTAAA